MLDKVLAIVTLAILAAFCGVLVAFVPEWDLATVVVVVVAMAAYDFYQSTFRRNGAGD